MHGLCRSGISSRQPISAGATSLGRYIALGFAGLFAVGCSLQIGSLGAGVPPFSTNGSKAFTVTSVSPGAGLGGTLITVTGTGFSSPSIVTVAGALCAGVRIQSRTQLTCTVPARSRAFSADIMIADALGHQALLPKSFFYSIPGWSTISGIGAPSPRTGHVAAWTGSKMIIWGGNTVDGDTNTGALYDPSSDVWTPMSTVGAPSPREQAAGAWLGARLFVFGGQSGPSYSTIPLGDGAVYDPATDSWAPVSWTDAPSARVGATATWTGTYVVVWGGQSYGGGLNSGARYDPVANQWLPVSLVNAPPARAAHSAIWTGAQVMIWGGASYSSGPGLNSGAAYDPVSDVWRALPTNNAPLGRENHVAMWTGSSMLIWGGNSSPGVPIGSLGNYVAGLSVWSANLPSLNLPNAASAPSAVFDGAAMLAWGGTGGSEINIYDPARNAWQIDNSPGAPPPSYGPTAVWTGHTMIVWGGSSGSTPLGSGGIYTRSTR